MQYAWIQINRRVGMCWRETDIPLVLQKSKKQIIFLIVQYVRIAIKRRVGMRLIYLNQFWGNGRWINQLSSLSDLTALKTYNFIWKNGRKISSLVVALDRNIMCCTIWRRELGVFIPAERHKPTNWIPQGLTSSSQGWNRGSDREIATLIEV